MEVSASDYRARVRDLADVLILWDIDGTLVTHAPATRDRHAHAVGSVLGRPVDRLPAGVGKTTLAQSMRQQFPCKEVLNTVRKLCYHSSVPPTETLCMRC